MEFAVGQTLTRRDTLGSGGYPQTVRIVDYDHSYRRWILDDRTEMTSASLDYLYKLDEDVERGGYA